MNSLIQSSPLPKEIGSIFPTLEMRKLKLRDLES